MLSTSNGSGGSAGNGRSLLDLVFSIDSILTAVGMTDHLPIMVVAVLVAVAVMLWVPLVSVLTVIV